MAKVVITPIAKSESVLSIAMRPKTLSGLIGQDALVKSIRAHVAKRPPRVWLLTGAPGTGKTTVARVMSIAYQCTHSGANWGDPCSACQAEKGFAIHEINASEVSGVDELEEIAEMSYRRPMIGQKRVIILYEVHNISKTAWSMLLKPTEDTPEFTVWILCTSELSKVPAANQRRATKYQLKSLSIDATEAFVKKQAAKAGIDRSLNELIEALHTMGIGAPGLILQALEKYAAGCSAAESTYGTDGSSIDSFKLCKAVTAGDWNTIRTILKNVTPEDVRWIRASVAGWLKGCLLRETNPQGQERAAVSLLEWCSMPFDEAVLIHWLHATLYKQTKRYAGGL